MLRYAALLVALCACACSGFSSEAAPVEPAADAGAVTAIQPSEPADSGVQTPAAPVAIDAGTVAAPLAECVAPPGATAQDVDPEDEPEVPFAKVTGQKVTVFFQNTNASERYMNMVKAGATTWSQSPCVDVQVVSECPANSNCVTVRTRRESEDDDDTDGEFEGDDHHGVRRGGTLTVFTKLMDKETDNGALATIVHEMGHAVGLVHRQNPDDLMNADTDDETNPVPDQVDFGNLLVIYGTR